MTCEGTTKAGKPCRAKAKAGERLCSAHLGHAGAPTKLDAAIQERVVMAIRAGNYRSVAARAAGIHPTTLSSWVERGEAGIAPYAAFAEAVKKADAEGETRLVALIAQAGQEPRHWTANAWILERTYPDRWGKRERHEHTGRGGGPIEVNADALKQPDVREAGRELIERVAAARAVQPGGAGAGD